VCLHCLHGEFVCVCVCLSNAVHSSAAGTTGICKVSSRHSDEKNPQLATKNVDMHFVFTSTRCHALLTIPRKFHLHTKLTNATLTHWFKLDRTTQIVATTLTNLYTRPAESCKRHLWPLHRFQLCLLSSRAAGRLPTALEQS